jgi:predicted RNA-binding Zn-ribbon protein involved in translation (DUF1610 family)
MGTRSSRRRAARTSVSTRVRCIDCGSPVRDPGGPLAFVKCPHCGGFLIRSAAARNERHWTDLPDAERI